MFRVVFNVCIPAAAPGLSCPLGLFSRGMRALELVAGGTQLPDLGLLHRGAALVLHWATRAVLKWFSF